MRYMLLLYGCAPDQLEPGDPAFGEALERVNAFVAECRRRGAFVGGDPLRSVSTATTVRIRDGQTLITDGPFAETHEHLGGYFILDCRGLDEALELAALWPMASIGSVEVRPLAEIPGMSWKVDASGVGAAAAE